MHKITEKIDTHVNLENIFTCLYNEKLKGSQLKTCLDNTL